MERTTTAIGRATAKKATWSLLLVLALMSATLLMAAPAMAQANLETENESESGGVAVGFEVSNTGDFAGQCTPALQFGNSGNLNNAASSLQYASEADDFEAGGIEFTAEPGLAVECNQEVQQAAAASSTPKAEAPKATPVPAPTQAKEKKAEAPKATPAPTPKVEKAGFAEAKAEAPKAEAKAQTPKAEAKAKAAPEAEQSKAEQSKAVTKELPKTGGDTLPILGIAGALLVGGGLLIRKLTW